MTYEIGKRAKIILKKTSFWHLKLVFSGNCAALENISKGKTNWNSNNRWEIIQIFQSCSAFSFFKLKASNSSLGGITSQEFLFGPGRISDLKRLVDYFYKQLDLVRACVDRLKKQ